MIQVIDSHTGGEPTRVIIKGGPNLGNGPLGERAKLLEKEYSDFCWSVLREPRGYDAMVGVLLVAPVNKGLPRQELSFSTGLKIWVCVVMQPWV
jgi:proline racemase/4-hydroxyproline epimerase